MVNEKPDHYISISDAAQHAGISPALIRKWVRMGRIRAFKAGRRTVLREGDVQRLFVPYSPPAFQKETAANATTWH